MIGEYAPDKIYAFKDDMESAIETTRQQTDGEILFGIDMSQYDRSIDIRISVGKPRQGTDVMVRLPRQPV